MKNQKQLFFSYCFELMYKHHKFSIPAARPVWASVRAQAGRRRGVRAATIRARRRATTTPSAAGPLPFKQTSLQYQTFEEFICINLIVFGKPETRIDKL